MNEELIKDNLERHDKRINLKILVRWQNQNGFGGKMIVIA